MKNKYIDAKTLKSRDRKADNRAKKSLKKDITLISEAMLKGSLGAYESIELFITSLQQEQPEVDLEKEILNYNVPFNSWERLTYNTMKEIAHHFFELGLNARKEE